MYCKAICRKQLPKPFIIKCVKSKPLSQGLVLLSSARTIVCPWSCQSALYVFLDQFIMQCPGNPGMRTTWMLVIHIDMASVAIVAIAAIAAASTAAISATISAAISAAIAVATVAPGCSQARVRYRTA